MMDQYFARADHFLHHGNMAGTHLPGAGKGQDGAGFRRMTARVKPGSVMPPITAIAANGHPGGLTDIRYAGNAAWIGARDALGLRGLRARALGRLIGADALRLNGGRTLSLWICLRLIGGPRRGGLGGLLTLGGGLRVWLARQGLI
jgi:hypothetical protein